MASEQCAKVDRSPDAMIRNYDEAIGWLKYADLQSTTVVVEDHFNGEHVATALLGGGSEEYHFVKTNHEGEQDTTVEQTVDRTEAAEIIGAWKVAGRKNV